MDKFLYPPHPVRCIITGPFDCGKSFLTNLVLNIIKEFEKIYIYSPPLHHDICRKLIKCFSNYIQINIPNISNEEDLDPTTDELADDKNFEISETEIDFESK